MTRPTVDQFRFPALSVDFNGSQLSGTVHLIHLDKDALDTATKPVTMVCVSFGNEFLEVMIDREQLETALMGPATWTEARIAEFVAKEAVAGAKLFMGKPARWHETPHWRCENKHVFTTFVKHHALGGVCQSCQGRIYLTFPEDSDGSL